MLLGGRVGKLVLVLYFIAVAASLGLYIADYAWGLDGYGLGHNRYYLRFLAMFGIGVGLYHLRSRILLSSRWFLIILVVIALSSPFRLLFVFVAYTSLAYVLLYLAYIPGGRLRVFNRIGDYSYGIYIFGYPTQMAVMQIFPGLNVFELFLVAFVLTLGLSMASWHCLEHPALALKRGLSGDGPVTGARPTAE